MSVHHFKKELLLLLLLIVVANVMPCLADIDSLQKLRRLKLDETTVKQYRPHRAMLEADPSHDEEENRRRLARNSIRLGVDTPEHRELINLDVPGRIFKRFDQATPKVSEGLRFTLDTPVDNLPFQEGPGAIPPYPKGSREYWTGEGPPGQNKPASMWEVMACPVISVIDFFHQPHICYFGDSPLAGFYDFFPHVQDQLFKNLVSGALVPLVFEGLFSPIRALFDDVLQTACDFLAVFDAIEDVVKEIDDIVKEVDVIVRDTLTSTVNDIVDAVNSVGASVASVSDFATGSLFSVVNSIFENTSRRRLHENNIWDDSQAYTAEDDNFALEKTFTTCIGDGGLCSHVAVPAGVDCGNCPSDGTSPGCSSHCHVCFQPIPEMEGACVTISDMKRLTSGQVPLKSVKQIIAALLARHLDQISNGDFNAALRNIYGSDDSEVIADAIIESMSDKNSSSPPSNSDSKGQRLRSRGQTDIKEELHQNKKFQEARKTAEKNGISAKDFDNVLDQMVDMLDGSTDFNEGFFKDYSPPSGIVDDIGDFVLKKLKVDREQFSVLTATSILEAKIHSGSGHEYHQKGGRRLQSQHDQCLAFPDEVQRWINGTIIEVFNGFLLDKDTVIFPEAAEELSFFDKFDDAADATLDVGAKIKTFMYGLSRFFDPFRKDSPLLAPYHALWDVLQAIASIYLFGCSSKLTPDTCDAKLPSQKDEVFHVFETRAGEVYHDGGCERDFETELIYSTYGLNILETILDALSALDIKVEGGGSVGAGVANGEFSIHLPITKTPVTIFKHLLSILRKVIDQVSSVCNYLDGTVKSSRVAATYQNTRWALTELACRELSSELSRGHGCDGLDNTCDPDKQIDECKEDIFPPDVDASLAYFRCNGWFPDVDAAKDCVSQHTTAVDDCKPVRVSTEAPAGECFPDVNYIAAATGCGERDLFDVTRVSVPVKVDGEAPTNVGCSVIEKIIEGKSIEGKGSYSNIEFELSNLMDNCARELEVSIDVFSNEIDLVSETVLISSNALGSPPLILVENDVCDGNECPVASDQDIREYFVQITAKDEAGNTGTGGCSTFIIPRNVERQRGRAGLPDSPSSGFEPLYHVASTEFTVSNGQAIEV